MPILNDELSVWDIAFRWTGRDPRRFWFRIPLEVEDHFRNLIDAILKAELACESITLEKRDFEAHEKQYSVYYWIDDIYACIYGSYFNRKLLRWAHIERLDFKLWCERMNIPLPEFWFPPGWNLEYELPEYEIHPGHWYIRKEWSREDWDAELKAKQEAESANIDPIEGTSDNASQSTAPMDAASEKLRPNQEARIACQQIAKTIWQREPDRTIASVIQDELIQQYGGAKHFVDDTVRDWIKVVAPSHVRDRRGRPRKNGGESQ